MPVDAVVMPALQRAMAALGQRPIQVEIPDDLPPVVVDPVLASQVLDNLLDNVARHTLPDAPMRITAAADSQAVTLRVEDGGAGVSPDAMPHIFEKFYRVPARRGSARQGTGLGLSVVKGMAEAMEGSVVASRSELGGLAIDLWLPVAPPPVDEEPPA